MASGDKRVKGSVWFGLVGVGVGKRPAVVGVFVVAIVVTERGDVVAGVKVRGAGV